MGRLAFAVVAGLVAYGASESSRNARLRRRVLVAWAESLDEGLTRSGRWV